MATNRRIVTQEKTHLDQDEVQQQPSITTPAVPQYAESIYHLNASITDLLPDMSLSSCYSSRLL